MRARGLATLRALFQRGEVYVDHATGEFFVYQPADREALRRFNGDWSTIAAVLKRAAAFRQALQVPGADPFLRMPTVYGDLRTCPTCGGPSRRCQSCGAPLQVDALRCVHCELAVEIVLQAPLGPEHARPRVAGPPGPGSPSGPRPGEGPDPAAGRGRLRG